MEFNGLPGIDQYLSSQGDGAPIDISGLDHIIEAITAYCGLTKEQSNRILCLFFQEIRSSMLRGDVVDLRSLGSFFVSSPKVTSNIQRVFPKFKAKKSLIKRLNGKTNI